ncbi:MAG: DUF429 domain-containing protein [Spirochaetia bacterium]|nr:DUF429 domain-containing protein [Spirochaetota bacterium]MCX8097364.1 DUF429 domain-containing protein [Spirochaetota bacterium]MDW8111997.1 DUF429 domain-containing protein [Spirochaetia bacterium]
MEFSIKRLTLKDRVLGIDLAGSSRRNTGYAFIRNDKTVVGIIHSNEDIIQISRDFDFVFIDAPLSIPEGRKTINDRKGRHLRECDVMLKELGIKFFPITLGPMRMLTERGLVIKRELESMGKKIFETLPGALYDYFGVNRKDKHSIIELFHTLGLELESREYTQDELDAIASLLIGIYHLNEKSRVLSGKDGEIVIV